MIDFPNSPSVGQTFNTGSGAIYVWDGVAWSIATSQTATALTRNLIVNPCFAISQENGSTVGTVTGYYPADQWRILIAGTGFAVAANSSYATNPSGSPGRLLFKTTTAKASLASGDYAAFNTNLEGARVYPLGYSGNTPTQAVLRFGFNGPAGTYSVAIRNVPAYTVTWTGQFTITAGQANTDTTQVLVIPSPPTGYAWGGGSAAQIEIWFTFACLGSLVAPANGWQAGSFIAGPGQFNLLGTVNNQAQVLDVGLYADPNRTGLPPPFQVPDYALDLFESQRYWTKLAGAYLQGYNAAGATIYESYTLPSTMRAVPSTAFANLANQSNVTNLIAGGVITPTTLAAAITISTTGAGFITFDMTGSARM